MLITNLVFIDSGLSNDFPQRRVLQEVFCNKMHPIFGKNPTGYNSRNDFQLCSLNGYNLLPKAQPMFIFALVVHDFKKSHR